MACLAPGNFYTNYGKLKSKPNQKSLHFKKAGQRYNLFIRKRKAMEVNSFSLNESLISAYKATSYIVWDSDICIRIGQPSQELDDLLEEHAYSEWCFITAWNPKSTPLTQQQNKANNQILEQELDQRGYSYFKGQGEADEGNWPAEESFLVLGTPKKNAIALGKQFEQHAILYGKHQQAAQLILISPVKPSS